MTNNHYEVLGVSSSASKTEIRRAYLRQARRYHPDFHRGDAVAPDGTFALRIRQVNAAWEVLGDDERRAAYDEQLSRPPGSAGDASDSGQFRAGTADAPGVSRINRPVSRFTPYDTGPDPSESWRYRPDAVNPTTVPSKILLAAPVVSFILGVALLVVWLPTGIRGFAAGGVMCLFVSLLLFVGAPLVAMLKSQEQERRVNQR